jgi:hypothetical protein
MFDGCKHNGAFSRYITHIKALKRIKHDKLTRQLSWNKPVGPILEFIDDDNYQH